MICPLAPKRNGRYSCFRYRSQPKVVILKRQSAINHRYSTKKHYTNTITSVWKSELASSRK